MNEGPEKIRYGKIGERSKLEEMKEFTGFEGISGVANNATNEFSEGELPLHHLYLLSQLLREAETELVGRGMSSEEDQQKHREVINELTYIEGYLKAMRTIEKKITEDDLTLAVHKAQNEKMPALFLSSGSLDESAEKYSQIWRNLIKFEKIKI